MHKERPEDKKWVSELVDRSHSVIDCCEAQSLAGLSIHWSPLRTTLQLEEVSKFLNMSMRANQYTDKEAISKRSIDNP